MQQWWKRPKCFLGPTVTYDKKSTKLLIIESQYGYVSFYLDIDECTLETDNCAIHATCNNTFGGFNCTCNPGYFGDGTVCNEIVLLPFGDERGDLRLTLTYDRNSTNTSVMSGTEFISPTLRPPAGFPFGDDFFYSIYVSSLYVVVIYKYKANNICEKSWLNLISKYWPSNDFFFFLFHKIFTYEVN